MITNGFGAMPDYAAQIKAEDRWAIVAYIRALQLSEHATLADVPAGRARSRMPADGAHADRRRADPRAARRYQRRLLIAGAAGASLSLVGLCASTRRSSSSRT